MLQVAFDDDAARLAFARNYARLTSVPHEDEGADPSDIDTMALVQAL